MQSFVRGIEAAFFYLLIAGALVGNALSTITTIHPLF
jgi:hypothetical protein